MGSKVVLIFDDLSVRDEALHYAVELASRMSSDLVLLMLLPFEKKPPAYVAPGFGAHAETPAREAFAPHVEVARKAGVTAVTELRRGEPSSELMKFLAETKAVQAIVWGGEQKAIDTRAKREKRHWLARMRDVVELPVVVPSLKS